MVDLKQICNKQQKEASEAAADLSDNSSRGVRVKSGWRIEQDFVAVQVHIAEAGPRTVRSVSSIRVELCRANRYYGNSIAATGLPYPATAIANLSSLQSPLERRAMFHRCGTEEVEMWSKEAFFCCLSFLVLPSLVRKYWDKYQDHQNPISRMRSSGAL